MRYSLATSTWNNLEKSAINKIVASNKFTMGDYVKEFELNSASYFNSKYAVMVNSGSSANLLSIASLFYHSKFNLKPQNEVIVPAVSWSTTYFPLHQYNLKLKFVDIDLNTLNFNMNQLESAISPNIKAIYAVNLLGNPNDFSKLQSLCDKYNIILLEDNCESMGAKFNNKYTGTFGICGSMSTFFSHHICTIEGGLVLTDDEELYHILLSLRAHGWTRNLPENSSIHKKDDNEFYELFRFILPGYNLRPTEISGILGIEQLKKLDNIIKYRQENARLFKDLFQNSTKFYIQKEIDNSSWFGFSLILKPEFEGHRDELVKYLDKNHIESRPIVAGNFVNNPVIKYMNYSIHNKLNNAEYLDRNGFFVGNSHENLMKEIYYLYDVTEEYFERL